MKLKHNLRKIAELGIGLTAIATLTLAGCGGDGGGGDGGTAATSTISGALVAGAFQNATVEILDKANIVLTQTRTNASGVFSTTVLATAQGPFVVRGGKANEQFFDEKLGASAVVAASSVAGDGFALHAVISDAATLTGASGITVSPITERMAAAMGLTASGVLPTSATSFSIKTKNDAYTSRYGFNPITERPTLVTTPVGLAGLPPTPATNADKYAQLLAVEAGQAPAGTGNAMSVARELADAVRAKRAISTNLVTLPAGVTDADDVAIKAAAKAGVFLPPAVIAATATTLHNWIVAADSATSDAFRQAISDSFKANPLISAAAAVAAAQPAMGGTTGNTQVCPVPGSTACLGGGTTSTGTAGYPATGTFAGKLSDGSACTVDVAADHSVTVSATSWPYTGSVKTTLDGFYFENTNGEIALATFYTGTNRFFESNAGNFTAATTTAPAYNTGLSFDASTGKLILAMGSVTTDISPTPAVGKNFSFSCVGNAFPTSGNIAPSEFNKAPVSNFKATSLVGTFNAPSNVNGTAACSFTVDATGNLTITSANFKNGSMSVPYTLLDPTAANNNANLATYNAYSDATGVMRGQGADWFGITLSNSVAGKTASISVNGNGPGTTSTGSTALSGAKPISCSTANDPNAKWTAYGAANAGTYVGAVDKNENFTGVGTIASCRLTIAADGTSTYTGTSNHTKTVRPGTDLPPLTNDNLYFDFAATNNATWPTFSVSLGPNTGTAQSGQVIGKNVFYALSNGGFGTRESCLNMVKQ